MTHADKNGLEGLRVGRAQRGAPHAARRADEVDRVAARRAARLRLGAHHIAADAVDVVHLLADADRREAREHAEVAREAKAVRVQHAVAVDEDRVRQKLRLRAAQLVEEREEEVDFAEGEVTRHVRLAQHDALEALVHDAQRWQLADDQRGARVRLALLDEGDVNAGNARDLCCVDEVALDEPTAEQPLPNPPARQREAAAVEVANYQKRERCAASERERVQAWAGKPSDLDTGVNAEL